MVVIALAMVPIPPFHPLYYGSCPGPSIWCISNSVRVGLTIRWGLRHLIGNGKNLVTSACHSRFCLQLCKDAATPQQIGGGCSLRGYNSSTRNGNEIGGVVSTKLASLFHIPSKSHTVCLNKKTFSHGKSLGSDKPYKS